MAQQKTIYGVDSIPYLDEKIKSLQNQQSVYGDRLNSSPTAIGGYGQSTDYDKENEQAFQRLDKQIQAEKDNRINAKWYTPQEQSAGNVDVGENSMGAIGTALDFISRPQRAIVGAVKHLVGQGTSPTLYGDIADNMVRNKNSFGDVLHTAGLPSIVSAPVGFGLDIVTDPVNWLTAGTSAVIPKMVYGGYKGIATGGGFLKGIGLAAKTTALSRATTTARVADKIAGFAIPTKLASKVNLGGNLLKLGEKSLTAAQDWEKFSGIGADAVLASRGVLGLRKITGGMMLDDIAKTAMKKTPHGMSMWEALKYSPHDYIELSRIKDKVQSLVGKSFDFKEAVIAYTNGEEEFQKFLQKVSRRNIEKIVPVQKTAGTFSETAEAINRSAQAVEKSGALDVVEKSADDVVHLVDTAADASKYVNGSVYENAMSLAKEELVKANLTWDDMRRVVESGALDKTGVKWWDNFVEDARAYTKEVTVNEKKITLRAKTFMDLSEQMISIFKLSKIALSPAAYTFAIVGNMTAVHMGVNGLTGSFLKNLRIAKSFYLDEKGGAVALHGLLKRNPSLYKFFEENPSAVNFTFGNMGMHHITDAVEKNYQKLVESGAIDKNISLEMLTGPIRQSKEQLKELNFTPDQIEKFFVQRGLLNKTVSETGNSSIMKKIADGGIESIQDTDKAGLMANEMFATRASSRLYKGIADKALDNPNNYLWKVANFAANKIPSYYDKIDQSFKLASFLEGTTHGYTIEQIRKISNLIKIDPVALAKNVHKSIEEGRNLYILKPEEALELSNVLYLNYNAMPSAIRVLRSLPLAGSPFASFMYGMGIRTGQTVAYNPSAFNKVTFAIDEFGGQKSPLEKEALNKKYYSSYKQPGMYRVPGAFQKLFAENPVYLNLQNAIPYYSLSMLGPVHAQYGDSAGDKIGGFIQRSPIFKTPVGSVLFDYIVLPMLLSEDSTPKGGFGQALYPLDAGLGTKSLYAGRTLAEAFVPNIAEYAGLLAPESIAEYLPLYRMRDLARATEGLNAMGKSVKQSPIERTYHSLLKTIGVPIQAPVIMNYTNKK